MKDAVTSYGASVVPFGDSALIEVPLPSGETPGLFIVLNTNRKHHCRLAALLTALQEISNLVPSHPQQPRSKHAAEATSLEATSLSPVAPQFREVKCLTAGGSFAGTQTFDPDAFSNLGCDPLAQDILIVKSTNHFFPAFDAIASEVLYVDTGLTHGSPYPSDPTKTPCKSPSTSPRLFHCVR